MPSSPRSLCTDYRVSNFKMDNFVSQADRAFVEEDYGTAIELYSKVTVVHVLHSSLSNIWSI
jgi:hypothetical protein